MLSPPPGDDHALPGGDKVARARGWDLECIRYLFPLTGAKIIDAAMAQGQVHILPGTARGCTPPRKRRVCLH